VPEGQFTQLGQSGPVALGGLIFCCGLPGWAIVRLVFNFIEKNPDAGVDEVAKEVKGGAGIKAGDFFLQFPV
jgi:hypothetical protein